jgi:hypothetical protein
VYEAVRVLRSALVDLTQNFQLVGSHNSARVLVTRRAVTNGQNALARVPRAFEAEPAMADPACDPVLAQAICELVASWQLVNQRAIKGLFHGGVVLMNDDYSLLAGSAAALERAIGSRDDPEDTPHGSADPQPAQP